LESCQQRNKFIYDSFDWNAAQAIVSQVVATTLFTVPNAAKIISARLDGKFIDPVTPSYLFESYPGLVEGYGTPLFYWAHIANTGDTTVSVTLVPGVDPAGPFVGKAIIFLVKKAYDPSAIATTIPDTENALVAFVLADMWEFLRQMTKYQAKLQEGNDLLSKAQSMDSPGVPRPRTSKNLSTNGSTLVEMTDSVCDIISHWEPDIRESIKDRIRRNYALLWDMELWPESIVVADADISTNQTGIVLPYFFDKVIAARLNGDGPITKMTPLKDAELPYYFNVAYNIFEQSGEPVYYNLLPSVGVYKLPASAEQIKVRSADTPQGRITGTNLGDVGVEIFLKGELEGYETSEVLTLGAHLDWTNSVNQYDVITTLSKPTTVSNFQAAGVDSQQIFLYLHPEEMERKHIRLELHPNFSSDGITGDPGSVLICGKRRMSPLVDDNDSPQLRNVANILINSAAADMFDKLGQGDMAAKYTQKAQALTQVLVKGDTEQSTHIVKVTPYTEAFSSRSRISSTFP
jgi:hypothetical protein